MSEEQANTLLAILTELVLDIFARQVATETLLRKVPGADLAAIEQEFQAARKRIERLPLVQDLRARRDPSQLAALVSTLRTIRQ
jgi:hypothetical protein